MSDYVKQHAVESNFTEGESWTVLSEIEQSIKRKIEAIGTPLKDCDVAINYGVKTGCNEAFIIDGPTKDRLIAEDPKSAEIIRPILRGRDIKRYGFSHHDTWLISAHNGYKLRGEHVAPIDVSSYPAIKAHLDAFWEVIEKRSDKGVTPYNLRNCAYWDDFSKQKIVWGNLCLRAQFAIVDPGFVINAPSPLIAPGEPWLLAFLNSKPADWYIRSLGVARNGGYFEYKPMFVEKVPIPDFSKEEKCELARLASGQDDIEVASRKIDLLVSSAFCFTAEERAFLQIN